MHLLPSLNRLVQFFVPTAAVRIGSEPIACFVVSPNGFHLDDVVGEFDRFTRQVILRKSQRNGGDVHFGENDSEERDFRIVLIVAAVAAGDEFQFRYGRSFVTFFLQKRGRYDIEIFVYGNLGKSKWKIAGACPAGFSKPPAVAAALP